MLFSASARDEKSGKTEILVVLQSESDRDSSVRLINVVVIGDVRVCCC